jgi:hypothetical protein
VLCFVRYPRCKGIIGETSHVLKSPFLRAEFAAASGKRGWVRIRHTLQTFKDFNEQYRNLNSEKVVQNFISVVGIASYKKFKTV